ncbi:hypothetical protein CW713_10440 [Methanophagales archaeon]|nr:MAG: hypothetical protein CW713_10440 [Methanophagales archaeon]
MQKEKCKILRRGKVFFYPLFCFFGELLKIPNSIFDFRYIGYVTHEEFVAALGRAKSKKKHDERI